jgi:hypothetical protein
MKGASQYVPTQVRATPDGIWHQLTFIRPAESLRRASLACAENHKKETGIIDFFCGLYLQDRSEISHHFSGDFAAVVIQTFPIHLSFAKTLQVINLIPVTMLQTSPHVIHLKRILDFGEGQGLLSH